MKIEFAGSCSKSIDEPHFNEDHFEFSEDGLRFALCDGASESYDSQRWAKILCRKFAATPKFGLKWLSSAVHEYITARDFNGTTWAQQSAYERGSFSTLLGIDYDGINRRVGVLAIGDSIALLVDGDHFIEAWPFADPERFKEHPTLLGTLAQHNAFVEANGFWSQSLKTIQLDAYADPHLFCMTDALGEWALRHAAAGTDGLARLASLTSLQDLSHLVTEERAARRMRLDDSTLVVLSFAGFCNDDGLSIP